MFSQTDIDCSSSSIEFALPCVSELMLPLEVVRQTSDTLEVLMLFQTIAHLPALAVLNEHNDFIGMLTRHHYMNLMENRCAREIFSHKSLVALLKLYPELFSTPLEVKEDERVDQVLSNYLNCDPEISFEALPVINKAGIHVGFIKVADMISNVSRVQNSLNDIIQSTGSRLEQEVSNAANLQTNLLKPRQIDLPGLRGLSTLITSSEIGGDFYDYYVVDGHWVVLLVGDVSGHGIAAGTMVSAAKASVNLLETDKEKEPCQILARLSDTFMKTAHQSLLMTMFVASLDTQTGELRYANAGHQFPYIYRGITESLEILEVGGLPLGESRGLVYEQKLTEMDLGDRLFIYTDGIVEEENSDGECFGYERLEALLANYAKDNAEILHNHLLESLSAHAGRDGFSDDVTLFCVEHCERIHKNSNCGDSYLQDFELVRIVDSIYRTNPQAISPQIARQNIVFLADSNFADLVPNLSIHGIRRILVRHQAINQQLGWNNMLKQHLCRYKDDLAMYLQKPRQHWEFQLTHSDEKTFLLEEVEAWLHGLDVNDIERVDSVVLLLDELIENGLYAAPRDGKNYPLFHKGMPRALATSEVLSLSISIQDELLGISLTDNWGTLTPCVFLNRLSSHINGYGLEAGSGGAGLYFIWRMSDYLQLRVFPNEQTQVCAFIDLKTRFDPDSDKGFQFFYHTEIYEESCLEYA